MAFSKRLVFGAVAVAAADRLHGQDPEGSLGNMGKQVFMDVCESVAKTTLNRMEAEGVCDPALNPTKTGFSEYFEEVCKAPATCDLAFEKHLTFTRSEAEWYCPRWARKFQAIATSTVTLCDALNATNFCSQALEIRLAQPFEGDVGKLSCKATQQRLQDRIQTNLDYPMKSRWMRFCEATATKFIGGYPSICNGDSEALADKFGEACRSVDFCETAVSARFSFTAPQSRVVCPQWAKDMVKTAANNCPSMGTVNKTEYCEAAWVTRALQMDRVLSNGNFTCASTRVEERERIQERLAAESTAVAPVQTAFRPEASLNENDKDAFLQTCASVFKEAETRMNVEGICDAELNPTRTGFDSYFQHMCQAPKTCKLAFDAGLTFTNAEASWYCPRWAQEFQHLATSTESLCESLNVTHFCNRALEKRLSEPFKGDIGQLDCVATNNREQKRIQANLRSPSKNRWITWCKASAHRFFDENDGDALCQQPLDGADIKQKFNEDCHSADFCNHVVSSISFSWTVPQARVVCPRWADAMESQLVTQCNATIQDPTAYCEAAWAVRAEQLGRVLRNGNFTCTSWTKESQDKEISPHVHTAPEGHEAGSAPGIVVDAAAGDTVDEHKSADTASRNRGAKLAHIEAAISGAVLLVVAAGTAFCMRARATIGGQMRFAAEP